LCYVYHVQTSASAATDTEDDFYYYDNDAYVDDEDQEEMLSAGGDGGDSISGEAGVGVIVELFFRLKSAMRIKETNKSAKRRK